MKLAWYFTHQDCFLREYVIWCRNYVIFRTAANLDPPSWILRFPQNLRKPHKLTHSNQNQQGNPKMVEKWKSYDDKFKIFIVKAKHAKSVIKKKKKACKFLQTMQASSHKNNEILNQTAAWSFLRKSTRVSVHLCFTPPPGWTGFRVKCFFYFLKLLLLLLSLIFKLICCHHSINSLTLHSFFTYIYQFSCVISLGPWRSPVL